MPLSSAFFFARYLCASPWEEEQLLYYILFKEGGQLQPVQEFLRNYGVSNLNIAESWWWLFCCFSGGFFFFKNKHHQKKNPTKQGTPLETYLVFSSSTSGHP